MWPSRLPASFHYNYPVSGQQESITLGRYGVSGITRVGAREL